MPDIYEIVQLGSNTAQRTCCGWASSSTWRVACGWKQKLHHAASRRLRTWNWDIM
jgi:hypothetical protein